MDPPSPLRLSSGLRRVNFGPPFPLQPPASHLRPSASSADTCRPPSPNAQPFSACSRGLDRPRGLAAAISALKPHPACKSRAKVRRKTAIPSTPFHNIVAKTRVLRGKTGAVIAHFRAIAGANPGQTGAFFTPNGPFQTPKPPWRSPNAVATP